MAKKVRILLIGDDSLKAQLSGLTDAEARKVIGSACRDGCKLIQRTAKSLAPKKTGALKNSIRVRALRRSRKRIGARVTTGKWDNLFTGKTFYGAFQEFGWKTGRRRPKADSKQVRRQIPAKNFMKQAADQNKESAIALFRTKVGEHIQKVMAKRK